MPQNKLRTPEEVRADFAKKGLSFTAWARQHGYSTNLVFEVLAGRKKCIRGQCHDIAVMLGLKHGQVSSVRDINYQIAA